VHSGQVIVVRAGINGVTAALELRRRGQRVDLLDPGPLPHPLAASTDISKVIRLDYGPDADYLTAMEMALAGWQRWNAEWPEPLLGEWIADAVEGCPNPALAKFRRRPENHPRRGEEAARYQVRH
jgi:glycine/D-amino acid oxidase-like deaminating enzyme